MLLSRAKVPTSPEPELPRGLGVAGYRPPCEAAYLGKDGMRSADISQSHHPHPPQDQTSSSEDGMPHGIPGKQLLPLQRSPCCQRMRIGSLTQSH